MTTPTTPLNRRRVRDIAENAACVAFMVMAIFGLPWAAWIIQGAVE